MTVLDRLACRQGRRDEAPNQELARDLAEKDDRDGIREIAGHLFDKDRNLQSDCIKVLYETGYLKPALISEYADEFIRLLGSRNNRAVWGAMLALSTIASLRADTIFDNLERILKAMEEGSVITVDNGVKVLASAASQKDAYRQRILPYLLEHLKTCRPKEVAQHAESTLLAVDPSNRDAFVQVLEDREKTLTAAQKARLRRIYNALDNPSMRRQTL